MYWKVKTMLIGEVARCSGVPAKTIRYYEDVGLVDRPARSTAGYRQYDATVLDRLGFIRAARAIGLSLGEIRSIIALRNGGDTPCGHVLALLRQRTAETEHRIRELRAVETELRRLVELADRLDPADCDPNRVCHLIGCS